MRIVGETNSGEDNEKLYLAFSGSCPKCDKRYALLPEKITWNANHDVYYTGGRRYLQDKDRDFLVSGFGKRFSDLVRNEVEQYTTRIKSGENLDSWNLTSWLSNKIEQFIADELYSRGLKM